MKILVTGNNGYIGPVVEKKLIEYGYSIVGLDTNYFNDCLLYPHTVNKKQIVKDIRNISIEDLEGIDAIIHLAALSNDSMGVVNETVTDLINYQSTCQLADLAKKAGVSRFVFASSCSIYGVSDKPALTEEDTLAPLTAYAKSKVNSEDYLKKIADNTFSPIFLRNATAYGVSPRIRFDLVLNNLVACAYTTGKIKIMSDGSPWRPIVHVEDMAMAMIEALSAPREKIHGQAINIGANTENYQIRDIATVVKNIVPNCTIEYTHEHGSDSRTYNVNFDKAKTTLPHFKPLWNLEKGAVQLYESVKNHQLTFNEFNSEKFTRLKKLIQLKNDKKINSNLYWQ